MDTISSINAIFLETTPTNDCGIPYDRIQAM